MEVKLLLGDFARVAGGKLDVLGAGWTISGPGPVNMGIGVLAQIPWAEVGESHKIELLLVDERGSPVLRDDGEPLFKVEAAIPTNRPPGVLLGAPLTVPLALNVNGVPLPPGHRFRLQATADGQAVVADEVSFDIRAAGAEPA